MSNRTVILNSIFSVYVGLIPILQYYKSPIASINLSTFFALLFFLVFLFKTIENIIQSTFVIRIEKALFPVIFYITFISLNVFISMLYYDYPLIWENISSYLRFMVLFFSIIILGYRYLNLQIAVRTLKIQLIISSFFIIIQNLAFYVFSIGFKPIITSILTDVDYAKLGSRFSGLYMEPSHFAQVAILYLTIVIFSNVYFNKRYYKLTNVLIMLGIVLSGSGQGYLLLFLLFLVWISTQILSKWSVKKITTIALIIAVVGIVLLFFIRLEVVQYSLSRIISDDGRLGGQALLGRTFTNVFFYDIQNKWLGVGFGHLKDITNTFYVNSLYSHLIQCGYLSVAVLVIMFIEIFNKGESACRIFICLFSLMIYFANVAAPTEFCFYLSYIISLLLNNGSKKYYVINSN